MKCKNCEMLTSEPIKVIDIEIPFSEDVYHFENGFKCNFNGESALNIEDLPKGGCKLER